jgi:hypothetical protein
MMTARFLLSLVALVILGAGVAHCEEPAITGIYPAEGSTVKSNRPTVRITFNSALNPRDYASRSQLWINGEDVFPRCLLAHRFISFTPAVPLPSGKATLRIRIALIDGNILEKEWHYTIAQGKGIENLKVVDPKAQFEENDDIVISLSGPPGGSASFDIGDLRKGVSMAEKEQGRYEGAYTVRKGDHLREGVITAHLHMPRGDSFSLDAPGRITVFAQVFRVKILSPANGAAVDNYFDIKGRTRPLTRVYIAPRMGWSGTLTPAAELPRQQGAIDVKSDDQGYFTLKFGFPIRIKGLKYTFAVSAQDDDGEWSIPEYFFITLK